MLPRQRPVSPQGNREHQSVGLGQLSPRGQSQAPSRRRDLFWSTRVPRNPNFQLWQYHPDRLAVLGLPHQSLQQGFPTWPAQEARPTPPSRTDGPIYYSQSILQPREGEEPVSVIDRPLLYEGCNPRPIHQLQPPQEGLSGFQHQAVLHSPPFPGFTDAPPQEAQDYSQTDFSFVANPPDPPSPLPSLPGQSLAEGNEADPSKRGKRTTTTKPAGPLSSSKTGSERHEPVAPGARLTQPSRVAKRNKPQPAMVARQTRSKTALDTKLAQLAQDQIPEQLQASEAANDHTAGPRPTLEAEAQPTPLGVGGHLPAEKVDSPYRRQRVACQTCRRWRMKCDMKSPTCGSCKKFGHVCGYISELRAIERLGASCTSKMLNLIRNGSMIEVLELVQNLKTASDPYEVLDSVRDPHDCQRRAQDGAILDHPPPHVYNHDAETLAFDPELVARAQARTETRLMSPVPHSDINIGEVLRSLGDGSKVKRAIDVYFQDTRGDDQLFSREEVDSCLSVVFGDRRKTLNDKFLGDLGCIMSLAAMGSKLQEKKFEDSDRATFLKIAREIALAMDDGKPRAIRVCAGIALCELWGKEPDQTIFERGLRLSTELESEQGAGQGSSHSGIMYTRRAVEILASF